MLEPSPSLNVLLLLLPTLSTRRSPAWNFRCLPSDNRNYSIPISEMKISTTVSSPAWFKISRFQVHTLDRIRAWSKVLLFFHLRKTSPRIKYPLVPLCSSVLLKSSNGTPAKSGLMGGKQGRRCPATTRKVGVMYQHVAWCLTEIQYHGTLEVAF
jgi:hypothetical protein